MKRLAILSLFVFAVLSFAADFVVPSQKIVGGEDKIPPGELVDLALSPMKEKPKYLEQTSQDWTVYEIVVKDGKAELKEKRFKEVGNGIFFGAGLKPRKLYVVCNVTYLFAVRDKDVVKEVAVKTSRLAATVRIGENDPDPDPGPTPPPPEPVIPDGQFKLAYFAYTTAMSKVKASGREAAAKRLAASFKELAKVSDGTDAAILKMAKDSNNKALGADVENWEEFSVALQEQLYALYKSGTLKGKDSFRTAWTELASGLEKVK